MSKAILFQAIQFSINAQFSSFGLIDRILYGAINPGQNGPESDGNVEVLSILQSASITGTSPSDCLMSYLGHLLCVGGGGYPSAEKQSMYSTAPADWATARYCLSFSLLA